jgi:hypothetical protein
VEVLHGLHEDVLNRQAVLIELRKAEFEHV